MQECITKKTIKLNNYNKEKNMPTWLFVLILVTNAILFLVPHWL
jgi:hypothetical protein